MRLNTEREKKLEHSNEVFFSGGIILDMCETRERGERREGDIVVILIKHQRTRFRVSEIQEILVRIL